MVDAIDQKRRVQTFFDHNEDWQGRFYSEPGTRFARVIVRRKHYAFQMLNKIDGLQPGLALDIGCGSGVYLEELMKKGFKTYGLDSSTEMLSVCQARQHGTQPAPRAPLFCGDIERIPFKSERFDLVVCIGVLGYLLSDYRALLEVRRILKPGKFLLLNVTNMLSLSNLDYVLRAKLRSFLRPQAPPPLIEAQPGVSMTNPWILQHADYRYKAYHPWRFERLMAGLGFRLVKGMTFGYEFRLFRRWRLLPEVMLNAIEVGLERAFGAVPIPYLPYSGEAYTALFQKDTGIQERRTLRRTKPRPNMTA